MSRRMFPAYRPAEPRVIVSPSVSGRVHPALEPEPRVDTPPTGSALVSFVAPREGTVCVERLPVPPSPRTTSPGSSARVFAAHRPAGGDDVDSQVRQS